MGSPDGGPYDETPPKVVHTSPKFGATNEKNVKRITIEFDEIVKVDNPSERVVISPPQIQQPEIEANGRRITVTLLDSLKPDMTYTIDFADAIVDNNEGNPYGDYAFTFSTGERVDTFQMSGHVLTAENLEPIKGMLVGLYKIGEGEEGDSIMELPDSVFRTKPFERISRTDSRGHFVVKGLSPGQYRAFALKDLNQNYVYDQRAEMVAFSERILSTSSRPDIRPDTIWHDSIHYDSIVYTPYTHFYPDDIVLTAFESAKQDRHLLKSERPILQHFMLYFTAGSDTLPRLTGLNFNSDDAFVIDASKHNDSIDYWIKDSLIYNLDTLQVQIDFFETDTTGNYSITTDTLRLISKLTKERMARDLQERMEEWAKDYKQQIKAKRRAEERAEKEATEQEEVESTDKKKKKKKKDDDDIEIPPLPEEFLTYKLNNVNSMDPDKNIDFVFEEPLDTVDLSKIHFSIKVDTLYVPTKFLFRQAPDDIKTYRLYAEWEADSTYQVEVDTGAFVNIYGKRCEAMKRAIRMRPLDSYSTLFVVLQGSWDDAIVQLLSSADKVVKTIKATNGHADFYFLAPGTYYLRLFRDLNGNGTWDTGDYDLNLQPEPLYYYPSELSLKAQWEITQEWNPTAIPLAKQKPQKITKQKPDKERTIKNRNAERSRK
ncbi:MAG: Ig-like domain-containing protein [Bacteroidaceae bacterium]|nr:Ig-like domain-containing protein [Bacteroidaceae bacterium]